MEAARISWEILHSPWLEIDRSSLVFFLKYSQANITKKNIMVSTPRLNSFDIFPIVLQEHFVNGQRHKVRILAQNRSSVPQNSPSSLARTK